MAATELDGATLKCVREAEAMLLTVATSLRDHALDSSETVATLHCQCGHLIAPWARYQWCWERLERADAIKRVGKITVGALIASHHSASDSDTVN